ncbi:MAG: hypothetical protein HYY06_30890 [Deltaproteobacteria bacterium]|nr:hypothetical protein [Deltaproteobacteria bacterium]
MNKAIYIILIAGGGLLTAVLAFFASQPATTEAAPFVPLGVLVACIAHCVMVFKMWAALPADQRRTSPGAAVGLLFIPVFNIYWIFNVYVGYATDFNKSAQARGVDKRISWGLLLCQLLLSWVPLLGLILQIVAISQICNGVNALRAGSGAVQARAA